MTGTLDLFRYNDLDHSYWFGDRRITGITQALGLSGLRPRTEFTSRRHSANFARAGRRGTAVHQACEIYDAGEISLYDVPPELRGYVDAYAGFSRQHGFEPTVIEKPMGHPIFQFGGTPDRAGWCELLQAHVVLELKQCELGDWIAFQLAGQKLLLQYHFPETRWERELAVRLFPDGTWKVREYREPRARGLFLAAVAIANYHISK